MDVSKLKKIGWQPKTSLEDGILKAYKFYTDEVVEYVTT
jgi:nucleoside-diphosphate-sugar epimerase